MASNLTRMWAAGDQASLDGNQSMPECEGHSEHGPGPG